jgi:Arc-like DNA binding domain
MALGETMAARVKKRTDTATNRESDKIIVRLPEGMRDMLAKIAAYNGRSMSAEVAFALAIHFAQGWGPETEASPAELQRNVNELNHEVKRLIRKLELLMPEGKPSSSSRRK